MDDKITITEEPENPELNRRLAQFRRNGQWLTQHGAPFFERFRGQYIAVSEGEIFASSDALGAQGLAKQKHPDDEPFVQYIPQEKYERIYAC